MPKQDGDKMSMFCGYDTMHEFWSQAASPPAEATRAQPRSGSGPLKEEVSFAQSFFRKVIELPQGEDLHVIVHSRNEKRNYPGLICHVWHGPERGSYIRLADGLYGSTPEACWCQMSKRMGMVELARFGFELCGTYRPVCPMGFDWTNRPPMTTTAKLTNYLERFPEDAWCTKALSALPFVATGSASHRETAVALLLSLPRRVGGFGVPLPQMNARIAIGQSGLGLTQKNFFVADMLWPLEKICVEYDSDMFHSGERRAVMDSAKRNALLAMGYKVVTLTNSQVKSAERFSEFVKALARLLGMRLRIRSSVWQTHHTQLRRQVLIISDIR